MAVITFHSNETKETGQTLSVAAIAAHMAIEHNYKILIIATGSLQSVQLANQKLGIPGIAHAISLEVI